MEQYQLKGKYEPGQTPEERIRNLMSPLTNLAAMINDPEWKNNISLQKIISKEMENAEKNIPLLKDYFNDLPHFYDRNTDSQNKNK